jgi:hypothetical protein
LSSRPSLETAQKAGNRQFIQAMEPMIRAYEEQAGRSLP